MITPTAHSGYLQGQLLIATPALRNSCFEKSVIYMCIHNAEGAMGIVVNHTLDGLRCSDIFQQMNLNTTDILFDVPVHFGGPVETYKGMVLHTSDYTSPNTNRLQKDVSLTSNIDILKEVTSMNGPHKSIVALGYAGWGAGQLESELLTNSWLHVPSNEEILFYTKDEEKWDKANSLLGVEMRYFSYEVGHA